MRRSRTGRRSGSPIPRRWKRRDAQSFRLVSDFSGRSPCRKTKRALAGTGCNLELEPSKQSSFEIQKAPKVSVMGWSGGDHDSHFNARLDADAGDGWFSRVLTTLYNTYVYICLYMVLVLVNLSIAPSSIDLLFAHPGELPLGRKDNLFRTDLLTPLCSGSS